MDISEAARAVLLDSLALNASRCLTHAGIGHVLLKGPTTANWLYSPPRPYRDVDILVRRTDLRTVTRNLASANIGHARSGRLGEHASHAIVLTSPNGLEIDLHVALPLMNPMRAQEECAVWDLFGAHIIHFALGDGEIPAFDIPMRCIVLALHSVATRQDGQVQQDLALAMASAGDDHWAAAHELAQKLGVQDLVNGGIGLISRTFEEEHLPKHVLALREGDAERYQLLRWRNQTALERGAMLFGELFPSRQYLQHSYPEVSIWQSTILHWRRLARISVDVARGLGRPRRATDPGNRRYRLFRRC